MKTTPFFLATLASISLLLTACSSAPVETTDTMDTTAPETIVEDTTTVETQESDMITILTPAAGETVGSPLNVTGTADVDAETDLYLVLYGADGEISSEANWNTDADGSFDFGSTYYFVGGGGEGMLEINLLDEAGETTATSSISIVLE